MTQPLGPASVLDLLGMVAFSQVAAFTRLSADSALAPSLTDRLAMAGFAGHALRGLDRVTATIAQRGADVEQTLAPFAGVLVEFDLRTQPSSWAERMLKAYVGYGVADDFARVLAEGTDEQARHVVLDALEGDALATYAIGILGTAVAEDQTMSSRLALWGRRLVGEALGVVQQVLREHPGVAALLPASDDGSDPQSAVFARLTAEHTRRMERLGFAA